MGYFPFFIDIAGRKGLIVGGGTVALRKAEKLLSFGPALTVAAPEIMPELAALPGVTAIEKPFAPSMLEGVFFAIAATDDPATNRTVSELCRERGILVNAADDPRICTFLFPALVKDGPLCAGISTEGACPTAAAWLRERIEGLLPDNIAHILDWLREVRPVIRNTLPSQEDRAAGMKKLFASCIRTGQPLNENELNALLEESKL